MHALTSLYQTRITVTPCSFCIQCSLSNASALSSNSSTLHPLTLNTPVPLPLPPSLLPSLLFGQLGRVPERLSARRHELRGLALLVTAANRSEILGKICFVESDSLSTGSVSPDTTVADSPGSLSTLNMPVSHFNTVVGSFGSQ